MAPEPFVRFRIDGEPQPKERARTYTTRTGKTQTVTPPRTRAYEALVSMAGRMAMRKARLGLTLEPVELHLDICLAIPKSWGKAHQLAAAEGKLVPKFKDSSNIQKAIEDGLNGVVYADDGQIVRHWVVRRYHPCPGVLVMFFAVPGHYFREPPTPKRKPSTGHQEPITA